MRFHREEYLEIMTFGSPIRQMFVELFGPLAGLEDEWRAQGATEDEINLTAFDWDYVPVVRCGGNTGMMSGFEKVVLEETPEYLVERDELGRTMKLPKGFATIALPLDFPVKDLDSWLKVKPLYAFSDKRIDWDAVEQAKRLQQEGALVVASIPGGFDTPRELMGDAAACTCYYENPELMEDILQTLTETSLMVLERVTERIRVDQLSVHEDMAGKAGPLIGPRQVQRFIQPYYRAVWDLLSSRGTRIFEMDSDGNMEAVIDAFLECGLTSMHPMEPAAGMDIVALRKKYGRRLAMKGGIDKHVLRGSKEEIRRELEYKLQPLMQAGGTVFGLDHRITNGTPIENYRYYVDLGREMLNLPRRTPQARGWARMAF
ncbi:MAG TPA: uroporphyrinogen decarboxylase family protein [Anaerolineaceae bacterium]